MFGRTWEQLGIPLSGTTSPTAQTRGTVLATHRAGCCASADARTRQVRRPTTSLAGALNADVPPACLKHRSIPVVSGQQGSGS